MFKIVVYIPSRHLSVVKTALFNAGAGKLGNYDCCCWSVEGEGQFRPLAGANPFLGQVDKVETVSEVRLELVCATEFIKPAIIAMVAAHPYEQPAYQVFSVVDIATI